MKQQGLKRLKCTINISLLAAISTFTLVGQAQASTHRFAGIMPGGHMISKKLVSVRERKFVNVIQQQTDFSCGAAALATVLRYAFNFDATEEAVVEGLLKISDPKVVQREGFSMLDLKNYAEAIGLKGFGVKTDIENLRNLTVPVIVLLTIKGYDHFVVLKKVDARYAYVADPALGNHIMEVKAFKKSWNGVLLGLLGNTFEKDTVLLAAEKPLSARYLLGIKARLPNSPFTDFGYSHKDYF